MSLTLNFDVARDRDVAGKRARRVVQITGPASYTAGGESLTASDLALREVEIFPPVVLWDGSDWRIGHYDYDNAKLVIFDNGFTEASGDLSSFVGRVEVAGKH